MGMAHHTRALAKILKPQSWGVCEQQREASVDTGSLGGSRTGPSETFFVGSSLIGQNERPPSEHSRDIPTKMFNLCLTSQDLDTFLMNMVSRSRYGRSRTKPCFDSPNGGIKGPLEIPLMVEVFSSCNDDGVFTGRELHTSRVLNEI